MKRTVLTLPCLALAASLSAQTITVNPGYAMVAMKANKQFTATFTGLANHDVLWSANGVVGGSATAGTITNTGLYTAPGATLPNAVQIAATSKASAQVAGYAYADILPGGPAITSASPNPMSLGNYTVTIQGSGFQAGAVILAGTPAGATQLAGTLLPNNTITGQGWLAPGSATSVTFTVKNPGSSASNALVVPVAQNQNQYTLNVVNGTGGGSFAAGAQVNVTANAPPAGQSFQNWTGGTVANPNSAATTLMMPASNVILTANYTGPAAYQLTVVNGSGSGTYTAGTPVAIIANAAAVGKAFLNWTGAAVGSPASPSTTLTMPASSASVTANYGAVAAAVPFPVTTHPRLWITQQDLPKLQSWATQNNSIYVNGMQPMLTDALAAYASLFPNGQPNPVYPDGGDTQGYSGIVSEQHALILAFNSLIDPSPANRVLYAQYARNILMYAMNEAAKGTLAGAPFRDPYFSTYNRASNTGHNWPLIVDWIYSAADQQNKPILSASDKFTVRNVFLLWANLNLNAATAGGDHPSPVGVTNDPQLLSGNVPYRMAANNYYSAHARLLTMMSLAIDPVDDPAVDPNQPLSTLGNSIRSYVNNATGAWLYQQYAMYGDPKAVASAYNLPGNGTGYGLTSGGLPTEGMLYGVSYGNILQALLALQTAGFNDPALSGPQIAMISTPMWDRFVKGVISSLTPAPIQATGINAWLGSVYQFASYGDLLKYWVTPDYMQPFALLAMLEQQQGKSTHLAEARWFDYNVLQGGPAAMGTRMTRPYTFSETLLYYMLYDPAVNPASIPDPRPAYPTTFADPGMNRIVAHTDWTPNGTMFDYRAGWESIYHQLGDAGQFELFRKGEWLTKELSNYDANNNGMTTRYHNTLQIQNMSSSGMPTVLAWEQGELDNDSQWMLGQNAGDPVNTMSSGAGYIFAGTDMTNLYNRPQKWVPTNAMMNVQQVTRSILWLNADYIVVYDRATTLNTGLRKRWNLATITNPAISANTATETLPGGQQLFVQSLLPVNGTMSVVDALPLLTYVAILEPSRYVMTVQDATNPADVRFLHVLQGADAGASMVAATYIQSSAGTAFDGAQFGATAVYFPHSAQNGFSGTTLPCGLGVHSMFVTGLLPNTGYSFTAQQTASGQVVTVAAGAGATQTDGAGVLRLTF